MKIKEMIPGNTYTLTLLVKVIEAKTTKNGKPYSCITATDGTDDIVGNFWEAEASQITEKYLGKVADVTVNTGEFVTVKRLRLAADQDITPFVKTAPIPSEDMYDAIVQALDGLETPLKQVALKLFADNRDDILKWSGAEKVHHAVRGGYLYHTYRMMLAALQLCEIYPVVDKELMVVGTVVHDIGKLKEIHTQDTGVAEYTVDGNLQGHVLLGALMVHDAAAAVNAEVPAAREAGDAEGPDGAEPPKGTAAVPVPEEQIRLLEHMVASHHGKLEYGAAAVPATPEAMMLHLLDMVDSRMYMYEDILKGLGEGQMSAPAYFLDRARVYKPVPAAAVPDAG